MNGAESMLQTLINNGVEVCFTNPGTPEMHMISAIGKTAGMRSIAQVCPTAQPICTLTIALMWITGCVNAPSVQMVVDSVRKGDASVNLP
ncbi:MAG TPA: hypothetical protein QF517_05600 [Pseudomonadales bacterium]|mgnify:CR=1 FL=1|nr:hypothetical protein [Gammaproteobacteria bacterium]MDP6027134.1 hypothetical protein [Pseudomonadales bacterium]MDP6314608.1 hypothetical protein [Pseudomonadales bacterium]MDP7313411.1 hypothetical protein [Pseudomonadales bacterium]MDP7576189.1 hypothetical protein [Pseudomonadales bacterium]|tara:strand:- start:1384 stop:1653 length:270 start_codon:yes stop_codon:yes gene_type:complete